MDWGPIQSRSTLAGLIGAALLAVGGCQTARVAHPLTQQLSGNDPSSQMEFWHTLAQRRVTSNDEAFHGLLLDLYGQDSASDYGGRVQILKGRKMLPANFNEPADQGVSRGVLAYSIVRALHIRGGWVMHLFGNSPRYALRELEFEGIYPPSSENQTFSGAEFLGIMGKMEDYQNAALASAPSPELAPTSQGAPGVTP